MTPEELKNNVETIASETPEYEPVRIPTPGPVLLNMADVKPRPVSWLWWHRLALGRLGLLVGRPGEGKSFLTLDMAARITTGRDWPDGSRCEKGSVLLICCEDDPGDTIRVRLDAAGADVGNVQLLKGVQTIDIETGKPREVPFTLADVLAMETALEKMANCRMVIIDPIGSYLGGRTDAHRDNEVRGVLAPVAALAEKYGPAVVIVAHTRKSTAKYADDTAMGSRAFTGIVRTTWHLMRDDEDTERRLLLPGKNNLSKVAPGLAFRIEPNETGRDETAHIVWEESPVEMHADDALAMAEENRKPGPEPEKRNEAAKWLKNQLADGIPKSVQEIRDEAKAAGLGVSDKTLGRALESLGGVRENVGTNWQWRIPCQVDKSLDTMDTTPLRENNLSTCPDDKTPGNKGQNELEKSTGQEDKLSVARKVTSQSSQLDPNKPGPLDMLNKEQRKKYLAIYHSRAKDQPHDKRHATAWRVALQKNNE